MKRITEMEESELLALTDKEIENLTDYECALAGVPMLPANPGAEPKNELPEPDVNAFCIAGFLTLQSDHADRILDAINSGSLFTEGHVPDHYETRLLEPVTDNSYSKPKIETKRVHSLRQWDEIKDRYSKYSSVVKVWKKNNKEYLEAIEKRKSITEMVWESINSARENSNERELIRREFSRYLELAEGNKRIALNFLEKVKSLDKFPELKSEFCS